MKEYIILILTIILIVVLFTACEQDDKLELSEEITSPTELSNMEASVDSHELAWTQFSGQVEALLAKYVQAN